LLVKTGRVIGPMDCLLFEPMQAGVLMHADK